MRRNQYHKSAGLAELLPPGFDEVSYDDVLRTAAEKGTVYTSELVADSSDDSLQAFFRHGRHAPQP